MRRSANLLMPHKANCLYFEGAGECNCRPAPDAKAQARRAAILTVEMIGAELQRLGAVQASTLYARLTPPAEIRFKQFCRLLDSMKQAGLIAEIGAGRLLWKGPRTSSLSK